ncbi:hypothetical protein VPAL9027_01809 [Vibrio palustris]|uniref:Uncharacterized protein n=1 Tax=Vibrio palustris TaxID=1918946 RepID=A0A1R4B4J2_9VIBR|nr:hypothetical protein VPAL9027_01809 [Vibrio palustris]
MSHKFEKTDTLIGYSSYNTSENEAHSEHKPSVIVRTIRKPDMTKSYNQNSDSNHQNRA